MQITNCCSCSFLAQQPNAGQGRFIFKVTRSDKLTHTQSVGLPWTGDRLYAERYIRDNTKNTQDIDINAPRRDSNSQCQQAIIRTPSSYTARPQGSASYLTQMFV
jgi:hypothetical protein